MHIEIGILTQDKLVWASVGATALLATHAAALLQKPANLLRTVLAALFFSALMQAWHMPIGPSELHLVGAMPIYLLFGFVPTLFGFGIGLLLQALVFEPQDLAHLAVNFLSLGLPLLVVHLSLGQKLKSLSMAHVLRLDATYYTGVTLMVGFWLTLGNTPTALADWGAFAASYLLLVAIEPLLTIGLALAGRPLQHNRWLTLALDEGWALRSQAMA